MTCNIVQFLHIYKMVKLSHGLTPFIIEVADNQISPPTTFTDYTT